MTTANSVRIQPHYWTKLFVTICQFDTINHKAAFTDITIPLIQNLQATNAEKQYKYQTLAFKTNKQWQQTFVIPPVLSAAGVIRNMLNKV